MEKWIVFTRIYDDNSVAVFDILDLIERNATTGQLKEKIAFALNEAYSLGVAGVK